MDDFINVRRHPNDWKTATYRVENLRNPHLGYITGGVNRVTPHPMLMGYAWCDSMVEGELAHTCEHGPPPHEIKVVVPKSCNDQKVWAQLAGQEYREPRPLDMSPEAVQRQRERALRAARTKTAQRDSKVETLTGKIGPRWPRGRVPSAERLSVQFGVSKSLAADAHRGTLWSRQLPVNSETPSPHSKTD